jgi:pimeloyl-ACP methyl ester carboxylesterase
VDGRRIEYRIAAPGGRQAQYRTMLVLLHEGLGSVSMWKDFPDLLAAATGRCVLVYSRYGYGASTELGEPRSIDYMHREALAALPQLLAGLNVERPVLVGHSDGASIAIIHAGSGHAVAGLVLLAPHVFVEDLTIRGIAAARRSFETTGLADKLARYHDHPQTMFRGWNDIWLKPEFRDWNIEACVENIRAPMMLIQSISDPYGTLAQIDAIARRACVPVEKQLFAGGSHSPHVDCRDETIGAIRRFVDSLDVS